jgi:hypothetical protein
MGVRKALYGWIVKRLLRVQQGEIIPEKYRWINSLFFPIRSCAYNYNEIKYDFASDSIELYGVRYSMEFFQGISRYANYGSVIEIKRQVNNMSVKLHNCDIKVDDSINKGYSQSDIKSKHFLDDGILKICEKYKDKELK